MKGEKPCSWQPEANINAPKLLREWTELSKKGRQRRLMETQHLGINYVEFIREDLSCVGRTFIAEICKKAGISVEHVALVWASPPCEAFAPADQHQ